MAGRRPTPDEQKALRGHPGKRKAREAPATAPDADLTPPFYLGDVAKAEWTRVAPELKKMGLLSVVDVAMLAGYCNAFERWRGAKVAVDACPQLYIAISQGLVKMEKEAWQLLKGAAVELGFSPASRGRVQGARRKEEEDDPFEGWMKTRPQLALVPGGKK